MSVVTEIYQPRYQLMCRVSIMSVVTGGIPAKISIDV